MKPEDVIKQAEKELDEEFQRKAIEDAKDKIREERKNKRWWHTIFPYKLVRR